MLFTAKISAETSAGVGQDTDIVLIRPGVGIKPAAPNEVEEVRKIYNNKISKDKETEKDTNKSLAE